MKQEFKYLITDPCYLISERDWDKLLDNLPFSEFSNRVKTFLLKLCPVAEVADTGVGDWVNEIIPINETKISKLSPQFAADSGMVCFVEDSKALMDYMAKNDLGFPLHCVATLYSKEPLVCEMDTSEDATVVRVKTPSGELVAISDELPFD